MTAIHIEGYKLEKGIVRLDYLVGFFALSLLCIFRSLLGFLWVIGMSVLNNLLSLLYDWCIVIFISLYQIYYYIPLGRSLWKLFNGYLVLLNIIRAICGVLLRYINHSYSLRKQWWSKLQSNKRKVIVTFFSPLMKMWF